MIFCAVYVLPALVSICIVMIDSVQSTPPDTCIELVVVVFFWSARVSIESQLMLASVIVSPIPRNGSQLNVNHETSPGSLNQTSSGHQIGVGFGLVMKLSQLGPAYAYRGRLGSVREMLFGTVGARIAKLLIT